MISYRPYRKPEEIQLLRNDMDATRGIKNWLHDYNGEMSLDNLNSSAKGLFVIKILKFGPHEKGG